jgi:Family of unknown function (DUF6885)
VCTPYTPDGDLWTPAPPLRRPSVTYARGSVDAAAVTLLSGPGHMAELHASAMPQKDNLCAAFWGALALRASGIEQAMGEPVDQDLVGREAGAIMPQAGDPASWLPPGARSHGEYRLALRTSADTDITGTSLQGLVAALERLSAGALATVPVAGPWTAETVLDAIQVVAEEAPDAMLVANVRTGPLWGSHPPVAVVLAALAGRHAGDGPPSDWDVGHFVSVAAVLHGPGASLVLVRDTYPSIGAQGHHLQPPERLAQALVRGDGREGGLLVIDAPDPAARAERRLRDRGFEIRLWDNGTPNTGKEG